MSKRIVAGVDGSAGGAHALRWALAEAANHQAEVVALMAWHWLDQHHAPGEAAFDPGYTEDDARRELARLVEKAAPSANVVEQAVCDLPVPALLDAAFNADLLVVGARGLGGFTALLLGSVSERVLEHSTRPVAVVRESADVSGRGDVVVGIDGSAFATTALRWAAAEARARVCRLHVVHAWSTPMAPEFSGPLLESTHADATRVLSEAVADPSLTGLTVERHLMEGGAARAVLQVAEEASLVVIGSRGRSRLAGVLLGSTSRQLAHHAPCAVVVVPAEA